MSCSNSTPRYTDWAIGSLEYIGTTFRGLSTWGDFSDKSPFDVPRNKWRYYSNGFKPVPKRDLVINCLEAKGINFAKNGKPCLDKFGGHFCGLEKLWKGKTWCWTKKGNKEWDYCHRTCK